MGLPGADASVSPDYAAVGRKAMGIIPSVLGQIVSVKAALVNMTGTLTQAGELLLSTTAAAQPAALAQSLSTLPQPCLIGTAEDTDEHTTTITISLVPAHGLPQASEMSPQLRVDVVRAGLTISTFEPLQSVQLDLQNVNVIWDSGSQMCLLPAWMLSLFPAEELRRASERLPQRVRLLDWTEGTGEEPTAPVYISTALPLQVVMFGRACVVPFVVTSRAKSILLGTNFMELTGSDRVHVRLPDGALVELPTMGKTAARVLYRPQPLQDGCQPDSATGSNSTASLFPSGEPADDWTGTET
jgi:hypothetical protein